MACTVYLTGSGEKRVATITVLRLLAPDIQEAILFLPRVHDGPDPIAERDLRPVVAELDWTA